ncbi:MAG: hypothetical protein NTV86_01740 [Planctomycetota bacterium]|nr:hypothetical protein [Planctomycetota bacterium]
MGRILIAMSCTVILFGGCGKPEENRPNPSPEVHKMGQDWILVQQGKPELVEKAIQNYASNCRNEKLKGFRISVVKHPSGFVAVTFPDGLPPYDIVNLIGWLNQPSEVKGIRGAVGWLTSPESGLRYGLKSDSGNRLGDTLIGRSSDGNSVQVYLPEAAICPISRRVDSPLEPDTSAIQTVPGLTFTVTLDVDPSFGNPGFKVTHSRDTNWNK